MHQGVKQKSRHSFLMFLSQGVCGLKANNSGIVVTKRINADSSSGSKIQICTIRYRPV